MNRKNLKEEFLNFGFQFLEATKNRCSLYVILF